MKTQIDLYHLKIEVSFIVYREVEVFKSGLLGRDFLTLLQNRLDHTLSPHSLQASLPILGRNFQQKR